MFYKFQILKDFIELILIMTNTNDNKNFINMESNNRKLKQWYKIS